MCGYESPHSEGNMACNNYSEKLGNSLQQEMYWLIK